MSRRPSSADKLSDEEMTLILIRLPLNCVHRYKCVSKRWFNLISDPYFIRQYIESHKNWSHHDHSIIHANPFFDFISLPSPYDGGNQIQLPKKIMDFSLKFIKIQGDWRDALLNDFNILATSHGLLLCNSGRIFYVRNPLTRECVELPPAQVHTSSRVMGFICYPMDPISSKVDFMVLVVKFKCRYLDSFDTDVFLSKTGRWESHEVICPPGYRGGELCWNEQAALVYNNIFHWRSRNDRFIITYDPINRPNDCKPIGFPMHSSVIPPRVHHMELSEGHIRMISSERHWGFFDVWELIDYEKGVWNMKYQVKKPNDFTITNTNAFLSQTNAEIVYLIHSSTKKLMVLNMKTGLPEQIIDLPINFGEGDSYGRAMAFVATPWPTSIPQLPILQEDQDIYMNPNDIESFDVSHMDLFF